MSTVYTSAVSFVDYKIVDDSLVEVGGVDNNIDIDWLIRTHYLINKAGKRSEIKVDSIFRDFERMYER